MSPAQKTAWMNGREMSSLSYADILWTRHAIFLEIARRPQNEQLLPLLKGNSVKGEGFD